MSSATPNPDPNSGVDQRPPRLPADAASTMMTSPPGLNPAGMNATEFAAAVTAITSAFGDPTRREIYLYVHRADTGLTASEIAREFDLHPNVARHHLDKLAAGGYLEVSVDRSANAGAGRPSKHYRVVNAELTPKIPVRHDEVLTKLLNRAIALLPPAQAERMAEEVGAEYGRELAAMLGDRGETQRSFRTALHTVADALSAHGFAARIDKRGTELRIVSELCPFGGEEAHPVICAVDRGMVTGMLAELYGATSSELDSSLVTGDNVCSRTVTGDR